MLPTPVLSGGYYASEGLSPVPIGLNWSFNWSDQKDPSGQNRVKAINWSDQKDPSSQNPNNFPV